MIDLNLLKYAIQRQLNTEIDGQAGNFLVYLNTNAYPDDEVDGTVVVMNATRIPFGFSTEEFDAESVSLTLTFDLPVDFTNGTAVIRDNALAFIERNLLGHKNIPIYTEVGGERYIADIYLEQQPAGQPYIDSGRITQQIIVTGKVLIQNESCGAVVGNSVKVSIGGTPLLKVSRTSSLQVGMDNNLPLSEGETLTEAHGISRTATNTMTFIYTGKAIENEFLKIAEGVAHDVNQVYSVSVGYSSFTVEKSVKIINVTTQDSAGVYLQYTLTMQTVGTAQTVEE